jgi:hypothetical protein
MSRATEKPTVDLIDILHKLIYGSNLFHQTFHVHKINRVTYVVFYSMSKNEKFTLLENHCAEYLEKHNSDVRTLKHKVKLIENKSDCLNLVFYFCPRNKI